MVGTPGQIDEDSVDTVMSRRAAGLTWLATGVAAAVTVSISASPDLRFAYRAPSASVALETAAGLVAALAAFLAFGRFRLSRSIADLALVWALALLATTMLLFFTGPAVSDHEVGRFAIWARALGTLLAAVAFVMAAFAPDDQSGPRRAHWLQGLAGYGASAAVALALLFVIRPAVEIPDELPVESLTRPLLIGAPALLLWHFVTAIAFAAATIGFVRRCRRRGDPFTVALALAMPVAAGAAVHDFLFPSPYPGYVFAGDLFRLTFFLVVLAGALAQISTYQRVGERLGMRRERERLARDLHDGPVQELALLQILIDQLARRIHDPAVARLDEHAAATLREWRRAVSSAVPATEETSLHELVEATARGIAGPSGVEVEVSTRGDDDALGPEATKEVLYLVREASSNAVRHGGASRLRILVCAADPPDILVEDDGHGFDPAAPAGSGHGMRTMAERARALGAELTVDSTPRGTRVMIGAPRPDAPRVPPARRAA